MSTFRNPVGPQPSGVYWRRRVVVGLILLAIVVVVLLIVFRPGGEPSTTETPDAASTGTSSPAPEEPGAACAAGDVVVTAATDKSSYAPGEDPQITMTLENTGADPCTINAGTSQQVYLITSGDELYWDSRDCQVEADAGAGDATVTLLPNEPRSTAPIVWDRTRSSPSSCDADRARVPAGGASYHLNITLGDLESNDVQFVLE